jgi:hypothetical protein
LRRCASHGTLTTSQPPYTSTCASARGRGGLDKRTALR